MTAKLLLIEERAAGITQLTLNDPDTRNAMSEEMAAEFSAAVAALKKNSALRVLILTGAGKAFSGGGHLDMLFEKTKIEPQKNQQLMEKFYDQFLSIRGLDVPVIAKINGHAVGAGMCLALGCDIRIASEDAKLGLNFVHLGLHPGMGATYLVPKVVGAARAAELLFAGKIIDAKEAARIGLVNDTVPAARLDATVAALAETIAGAGPQSVRGLKESLRRAENNASLADCLKREAECQAANYASSEFLEGINAAREKRKPAF